MAKNNKSATRGNGFLTPTQQWLALTLLAVLVVVAIFYFGIGGGDGAGHSG
ncbi:MAG: hypothetical protein ACN4GZ_20260 [Acidimicrobiales bacterium]